MSAALSGFAPYLPGVLGLALFAGAWPLARTGRHRAALGLIVAGGLALRLTAAADPYLHEWDERYHALVAKNLAKHPLRPTLYDDPVFPYDYRDWSANHIWVHKQPLPLWAMALSLGLFGSSEFAVRLPSVLLSTAAVGLTAAIGSSLYGPAAGALAALFHAANPLVIHLTGGRLATDHVDVFHLFFVELAACFALLAARRDSRGFDVALGCAIGLAVLCKWLTALVVLPLWLLLVLGRVRPRAIAARLALIAASCCAVFLPWQLYIHAAFPLEAAWESSYNTRHLTEVVEGHAGPWSFYLRVLPRYGTFVALPVLWFLAQAARAPRDPRWTFPLVWFGLPLAFFTLARTKMTAYTMLASPALFVMAAAFALAVRDRLPAPWRHLGVGALVLLLAAPPSDLRGVLMPSAPQAARLLWAAALKRLAGRAPDHRAVYFNAPPIETMFYAGGSAYSGLPANEQVDALASRGYRVYVIDAGRIPAEFRAQTRATLVVP